MTLLLSFKCIAPPEFPTPAQAEYYRAQGFTKIPVLHRLDGWAGPQDVFAQHPAAIALLETTQLRDHERYAFIALGPVRTFRAKGRQITVDDRTFDGNALDELRRFLQCGSAPDVPHLPPFLGGAIGFVSYEAAAYWDDFTFSAVDDLQIPDLAFYGVDHCLIFDLVERVVFDCRTDDRIPTFTGTIGPLPFVEQTAPAPRPTSNLNRAQYYEAIARIQHYIHDGHTYQTNLSQRLETVPTISPWECYRQLTITSQAPFGGFFPFGDLTLVCASPERLVDLRSERASTRPIAGTRRRGTPEEDLRFQQELRDSVKEQAEHAMLVDLERNDLGRVAMIGSVVVEKFAEVTEYQRLYHLESEVTALVSMRHPLDVLGAMFPGGTITGVPKKRTMEIIAELEPQQRGTYTGSLGYIAYSGAMDFNILIRTILFKDDKAYVHVGGGITSDGISRLEYQETFNKARAQLMALQCSS